MHFHRGGLKPGGPMEYWQESCREGYNFLGVCDDHLRMRMVVAGSTEGRGQDKTMQDGLPWLGGSTGEYFDGKQFVMADKGFKCDNTVLPLYDLDLKQQEIDDPIIQRQVLSIFISLLISTMLTFSHHRGSSTTKPNH